MMYIYKITNLVNGKVYVGKHIWDGDGMDPYYFCSSTNNHFWNAVRKYAEIDIKSTKKLKKYCNKHSNEIKNFKKELIYDCTPYSEIFLNRLETYYIVYFDAIDPKNGYNLTEYNTGWYYVHKLGLDRTPGARKKKSESLKKYKKTDDHRKHISEAKKGKKISETAREHMKEIRSTDEYRARISESTKSAMQRPEVKAKMAEHNKKPRSEKQIEHARELGKSLKGKEFSESHRANMSKAVNIKSVFIDPDGKYVIANNNCSVKGKRGFTRVVKLSSKTLNEWYDYCSDNSIDPTILVDIYDRPVINNK